ncbi:dethiobiotin synthase [Phaeobacter sp. QD34_3]|uniref:dethiobiotin synthase n=1 Tax=unclassified Phaeobacter TaxID=2621772 RepID=UPI00237FBF99|nr:MULTISPECIES: dethiobiotin synthase [unclassified Phaeobacter]MDE4133754.1 dethiobiotin synthase [Phaeobacter sp. QD34_3]MDE4137313.1 dethiobiotin synthase [Phaeobacter sp. QD34_24]MDE4176155.1 dethiobiotin synthase [Phaeobacter sp. PT47_59]
MSRALVVTGTDTGIGKTVISAALVQALGASYWKPVQSGLEEETDSAFVAGMANCHILPEAYRLQLPASPHLSAEAEGVEIALDALDLPQVYGPLVVEGAGGLMVPLNRGALYVDLFARWQAPVVLCASTRLGTINHTLLSLEALRARNCPVVGVIFSGDPAPQVEETICQFGKVVHLGRLPVIAPLTPDALRSACAAHIDLDTIRKALI